jgi:hypothetical protein
MLPGGKSRVVCVLTSMFASQIQARLGAAAPQGCQIKRRTLAFSTSVACAALTTVAQAADRPARQGAPIEYARICDSSGAGYFYIPGTDRCLPAGGLVPSKTHEPDIFFSIAGPQFCLNSLADVTGGASAQLGGLGRQVNTVDRPAGLPAPRETTVVGEASMQFVGLTSGRAQFMFDSYAVADNCENLKGPGAIAPLLAYTATFGDGLSPTLSLEAPLSRQQTAGRFQANAFATIAPFPSSAGFAPPYAIPALTGGSYELAMGDGVLFNLDYLSPSDKLWLQAAYEKGAANYVAGNDFANAYGPGSKNLALGTPPDPYSVGWNPQIGFNCAFAGSSKCAQQGSWDITGAYKNYWLPILGSTTFGSAHEIREQVDAPSGFGTAGGSNLKGARMEPSLFRSPVRGFDIGAEYMYAHLSQAWPAGPALDSGVSAGGLPTFGPNIDVYEGRLRVQHGF